MSGPDPMTCTARIRPFTDDTEVACEDTTQAHADDTAPHRQHSGVIRDYAYPGSATTISWFESDRRNFHEGWPGRCFGTNEAACILPAGHEGNHAA